MDTITLDTAVQLAGDVRAGRRSAVSITREYLARIEQYDGNLNAFQSVRNAGALADAAAVDNDPRRADLPLAGVPVAVKDNMAIAGEPVRHGSAATSAELSPDDDLIVTRLRRAGAVLLGTTRMPELAAWAFTSSQAYGVTRNPIDPGLDPGGSSGGAAAAVAAGMAAVAIGTDGGGSIRVPAAYCGLVGIKPTRGLTPLPGDLADHWYGLSVTGPLARTAGDVRLVLEVLSGKPVAAGGAGVLRIATSTKSPSPLARLDTHQRTAMTVATERLVQLGHDVTAADPDYPLTLLNVWGRAWLGGIAEEVQRLGLDPALLERRTRAMVRRGRKRPRPGDTDEWARRAESFFADHDVLATPVTARTPARAGALNGRGYLATYLASARAVPFCQAWNLAGYPAVTVPVGVAKGLPLAVQLVGPPNSEATLLALAATLQNPRSAT
ncbi:amidase [Kribbella sp. NPDC004536]|uniref:amidase n=1 Tax=Kribbella sp. NPDC004536 TaxID=3364106 RepID=UPI0036C06C0B